MSQYHGEYLECCGLDTGWFGSSLIKHIGHAVSGAAKAVGHAVGGAAKVVGKGAVSVAKLTAKYNPVVAQAKLIKDIATGKNVLKSTREFAGNLAATARIAGQFVPGGPLIIKAVDVAVAVGKGQNIANVALGAVRSGMPPDQQKAFDAAVGLIHGHINPADLANARNLIAGTPALRAAFDAGVALKTGATKPQIAARIAAHADPVAKAVLAKAATVHAAVAMHAPPARRAPAALDPKKRAARAARRVARPLSSRAKAYVMKMAHRRQGAAGLIDDKTYQVDPGDSAFRIAQNLTGSPTLPVQGSKIPPWKELLMANTQKNINDGYNKIRALKPGEIPTNAMNFSFLKTGEKLNIPQTWRDAAIASAKKKIGIGTTVPAATVAVPAPPTKGAPSAVTQIPVAPAPASAPVAELPKNTVVSSPIPGGERDDAQAIAQAKLILAAWGATDGVASSTMVDYGARPEDASPLWGSRDNLELFSFVDWANKHGSKLATAGDLTQPKLDALVAWSEAKSRLANPAAPPPPVSISGPGAAQTPATPPPDAPPPPAPLPGPVSEPPGIAGSAAPVPATPSPGAQAGTDQASMGGGAINVPETLIAGSPKSSNDWILLLGIGAVALLASSSGKGSSKRRAA